MEAQLPQGELRDALSGGGEGSESGKSTFGGSAPLMLMDAISPFAKIKWNTFLYTLFTLFMRADWKDLLGQWVEYVVQVLRLLSRFVMYTTASFVFRPRQQESDPSKEKKTFNTWG